MVCNYSKRYSRLEIIPHYFVYTEKYEILFEQVNCSVVRPMATAIKEKNLRPTAIAIREKPSRTFLITLTELPNYKKLRLGIENEKDKKHLLIRDTLTYVEPGFKAYCKCSEKRKFSPSGDRDCYCSRYQYYQDIAMIVSPYKFKSWEEYCEKTDFGKSNIAKFLTEVMDSGLQGLKITVEAVLLKAADGNFDMNQHSEPLYKFLGTKFPVMEKFDDQARQNVFENFTSKKPEINKIERAEWKETKKLLEERVDIYKEKIDRLYLFLLKNGFEQDEFREFEKEHVFRTTSNNYK